MLALSLMSSPWGFLSFWCAVVRSIDQKYVSPFFHRVSWNRGKTRRMNTAQRPPEGKKVKLSVYLIKHYAVNHMGEWMYGSIYSSSHRYLEVSGHLYAPVALLPGQETPVPIGYEAEWTSEPVWKSRRGGKSCLHRDSNSDPSAIQPVASRYTDCTIPALHMNIVQLKLRGRSPQANYTDRAAAACRRS
jgi:hypothetical protein